MGKMTLQQILMQLAGGMGTSIQIFAVTLVFSLPLGLFVSAWGGRFSEILYHRIFKCATSAFLIYALNKGAQRLTALP